MCQSNTQGIILFYTKITEIQIENTSICNAACPMCLRENTPDDKTWFEETYLDTEFFKTRIPDHVLTGVESILFNGVLGDSCAAPNFLEVCSVMRERVPHATITISTNGGLRTTKFWRELAEILGTSGRVIFAIDGLKDTNHIYRVNVNFDRVIENAKAFIQAGGIAEWQFISFKHNQHQIKEAELLAKELGFKSFFVKPSYRFTLEEMAGGPRYSSGVKLEPPDVDAHPITFMPKFNLKQWHESTNNSRINCYAQHTNSIYIEYTGRLFPCCPLSSGLMYRRTINFEDSWDTLWNTHGKDKINLKTNDWDSIVNGDFFLGVKDSWNKDYSTGRLAPCAGVCSDSKLKFNNKNGSS